MTVTVTVTVTGTVTPTLTLTVTVTIILREMVIGDAVLPSRSALSDLGLIADLF